MSELTAFVVIADNLSFHAAAACLGVALSVLSNARRQLKERFEVRFCTARRAAYR